jgi:hypothetical protein
MSLAPVSMTSLNSGGQLELAWPLDHLGWFLQIQTNTPSTGLSTNWTILPGSAATNQYFLPLNAANANVFLRLMYPN